MVFRDSIFPIFFGGDLDCTADFFDFDEGLKRLSDIGDLLEAYAWVVDFEIFRPALVKALNYADGSKGGRPPFDPILMFKVRASIYPFSLLIFSDYPPSEGISS